MPHSDDLGNGIFILDVAPKNGCIYCGNWMWGFAMVDTNQKVDLLTDKPLNIWTARSDCMRCHMTSRWNINPDEPLPESYDEPFAK